MKYTNGGTKMDSSAPFEVAVTNGGRRASSPNQLLGGGPFHGAVIQYLSTQGKKIVIILCAFMLGTLIGSSFPYYTPETATACTNSAKVALNAVTQPAETFLAQQDSGFSRGDTSRTNQRGPETPPSVPLTNYSASHISISQNDGTPEMASDGSALQGNEAATVTENRTTAAGIRPAKTLLNQLKAAQTANSASNDGVRTKLPGRSDKKYLVNTPECKIPKFDPWDESVRHAVRPLHSLDCGNRPLTYVIGDVLRVNESNMAQFGISDVSQMQCCYSEIVLEESKVEPIISENCTIFKTEARLKEEFIRVQCQSANLTNIYTDFHYTIPLKPEVESRCSKAADRKGKKSAAQQRYSVMILGLDATSRLNFERHLPRSRDYILNTLKGVEMLGYNKVGDNTFPNLVAMLTGDTVEELKAGCWPGGDNTALDNCPWLWKRFASLGYRTMYGEDSPTIDTFHYVKKGFVAPPTDYFLRPLLLEAETAMANTKDGNVWLCLGQRFQYQVATSWALRFMERFRSAPYFGLMWSNSLTHDFPNHVQHADGYLEQSLRDLDRGRHLTNTFLFIVSDHGARWGSLRETMMGRYEEHLPALYVIPPRSFRKSRPKEFSALLTNSKRLTTTFDFHATLKAIADLALPMGGAASKAPSGSNTTNRSGAPLEIQRALSWFSPVPWKRTCQQSGVDPHWCACDETVAVNPEQPLVRLAATLVVAHINNRTAHARERCQPLIRERIVSALRETNVQTREREIESEAIYHVVVLVQPGAGLFEGTIRSNDNGTSMRVQGPISRLSLYGNQSSCVTARELKMFCYCTRGAEDATESEIRLASPINIDPR